MQPFLAVLGGGNMAKAIVLGGIRAGILDPSRVVVAEVDREKHDIFSREGVRTTAAAREALTLARNVDPTAQVVLAVKPQSFEGLCAECRGAWGNERAVVISIMAGVTSARIRGAIGGACAVVRAMPNLPAQIGAGATAVCLGDGAAAGDDAFACALFAGLGPLVIRTREELMDAFTAVAGSGPAYLFYLAEAMTGAAESLGFSPQEARAIVGQTLSGAGAMLAGSALSARELRGAVTSKGGTTQAATDVLDASGVMDAVKRAVGAAQARGRALGGG